MRAAKRYICKEHWSFASFLNAYTIVKLLLIALSTMDVQQNKLLLEFNYKWKFVNKSGTKADMEAWNYTGLNYWGRETVINPQSTLISGSQFNKNINLKGNYFIVQLKPPSPYVILCFLGHVCDILMITTGFISAPTPHILQQQQKTLTPPAKLLGNFRIWGSIYDMAYSNLVYHYLLCNDKCSFDSAMPYWRVFKVSTTARHGSVRIWAFDQHSSQHFEQLPILKPWCTQSTWGPCQVKCSEGALYIYTVTFLEAYI